MKNDVELFSANTVSLPFLRISGRSMETEGCSKTSTFSGSLEQLENVMSRKVMSRVGIKNLNLIFIHTDNSGANYNKNRKYRNS